MKRIIVLVLFLFLSSITLSAFALRGNYDEFVKDVLPEQSTPKIIPKGSFFRCFMGETVSSEFNNNGDKIKILVPSDFSINNTLLIPKNSMFIGRVNNLEKAQQGRNGIFSVDIIGIVLPNGNQYPAKGYISNGKNNRIFGGEFSRRSGYKTTVHRAADFHRRGALLLQQNGERTMGEETLINMGALMTIVIEENINLE